MNNEPNNGIRILLVEDDANLCLVLQDYLELLNYEVAVAHDGEEGLKIFQSQSFNLCILDVMLPKLDGFSLASTIRGQSIQIPIIFLTAKSLKEDRLKGFAHGCDDYITKPFSTQELNLRIKAILRRCIRNFPSNEAAVQRQFQFGDFLLDTHNLTLTRGAIIQNLTRKEASLLKVMCENKNKVLARDMVQKLIWGETDYFVSRSMDVFIARLRKYIKDDPAVRIVNVHGVGFMLEADSES